MTPTAIEVATTAAHWLAANPIEALATALGLTGTWLIRKPGRWHAWGFACWICSNPLVAYVMVTGGHWLLVLVLQSSVYWIIAWPSLWHWGIKPWLARRALGICSSYKASGTRENRHGTISDFCQQCGHPAGFHDGHKAP